MEMNQKCLLKNTVLKEMSISFVKLIFLVSWMFADVVSDFSGLSFTRKNIAVDSKTRNRENSRKQLRQPIIMEAMTRGVAATKAPKLPRLSITPERKAN
jgi:hypothetical protein